MSNLCRASVTLLLALAAFSGCSKDEKSSSGKEVRGQPIRSQIATNSVKPANAVAAKSTNDAKASTASIKPKPALDPNFVPIGFDKLASYTFNVPEGVIATNDIGKSAEQIPKEVRAFNEKKVALTGFMLPLKVDNGLVTEMLIMKDQSMCCYGAIPRINDWVSVKMKTAGVKSVMDQSVTLYGKIRVGEMLENGYLVGVYEMDGEKMEETKD